MLGIRVGQPATGNQPWNLCQNWKMPECPLGLVEARSAGDSL